MLLFVFFLFPTAVFSQTYDLLKHLHSNRAYEYNYSYNEFDNMNDTSLVLSHFRGKKIIGLDSIRFRTIDSVYYYGPCVKIGQEIKIKAGDTISIIPIEQSEPFVIEEIKVNGPDSIRYKLSGWLFPDSIYLPVVDSLDPIPVYSLPHIYRFYSDADSMLFNGDTLLIHYRPAIVNYYDSYLSENFYITSGKGLVKYLKYFSYFGQGFSEKYSLDYIAEASILSIENPEDFLLSQNYPNPFNPTTSIEYKLAEPGYVSIKVFDALGREVAIPVNEFKSKGNYKINFDASILTSGIYFYQLKTSSFVQIKKMLLLK
jgi:hypothetical protein